MPNCLSEETDGGCWHEKDRLSFAHQEPADVFSSVVVSTTAEATLVMIQDEKGVYV